MTDASLLGAGTLREGDPEMRGAGGIIPNNRIRAVITMSGKIPVKSRRLFRMGPPPVVFTSSDHVPSLGEALGHRARVVSLPEGTHGLSVDAAISDTVDADLPILTHSQRAMTKLCGGSRGKPIFRRNPGVP